MPNEDISQLHVEKLLKVLYFVGDKNTLIKRAEKESGDLGILDETEDPWLILLGTFAHPP